MKCLHRCSVPAYFLLFRSVHGCKTDGETGYRVQRWRSIHSYENRSLHQNNLRVLPHASAFLGKWSMRTSEHRKYICRITAAHFPVIVHEGGCFLDVVYAVVAVPRATGHTFAIVRFANSPPVLGAWPRPPPVFSFSPPRSSVNAQCCAWMSGRTD